MGHFTKVKMTCTCVRELLMWDREYLKTQNKFSLISHKSAPDQVFNKFDGQGFHVDLQVGALLVKALLFDLTIFRYIVQKKTQYWIR